MRATGSTCSAAPRSTGGGPWSSRARGAAFVVSDLSWTALAEQLERAAGGLDRRFWLFAVVGAIAAVLVLITVAVFVDSFVL